MREILFRGLHRRRGEKVELNGMPVPSMWVYGGYCQYNTERGIIYQKEPFEKFSVYVDSVGQYTGLTDKNGAKIFEGDIVRCKSRMDNANMVIIYECGQFRMILTENYSSYQTNGGYYDINNFEKEVVGNIYDNPELFQNVNKPVLKLITETLFQPILKSDNKDFVNFELREG